jgi:hypothetical protein
MTTKYESVIQLILTAVILVALAFILATLTGCAYYSVKKTETETIAKALTWRDSNKPFLQVKAKDGDITEFTFSAEAVDNPGFDDLGQAVKTVTEFCVANPSMC